MELEAHGNHAGASVACGHVVQVIEALVLDFDGVIVDTETPLFHAWAHTYATFGAEPIEHADWCASLGRNEHDTLADIDLRRSLR